MRYTLPPTFFCKNVIRLMLLCAKMQDCDSVGVAVFRAELEQEKETACDLFEREDSVWPRRLGWSKKLRRQTKMVGACENNAYPQKVPQQREILRERYIYCTVEVKLVDAETLDEKLP